MGVKRGGADMVQRIVTFKVFFCHPIIRKNKNTATSDG